MGSKRDRSDSDDDGSQKTKSHKKDKKHKQSTSPARQRSPARKSDGPGDDAERKRKRLEAWKAMQSSVASPSVPAPAPAPAPAPVEVPAAVGKFKLKPMSMSKPGGMKLGGMKKQAAKPNVLGFGEDEDDKPKLGALPPLGRQSSGAPFNFSPPSSPQPASPPGVSDIDDDVDPLDAFMTGISNEVKESIGDMQLAGPSSMRAREQQAEKSKLQTVSLDDILGGTVAEEADMMDEDVDEDKLEADRQKFMEAIRKDREERAAKEEEERIRQKEQERLEAEKAKMESKTGRFLDDEEEEEYWVDIEEEEQKYLDALHKKKLAKDLPPVDHDKVDYMDFQRQFYTEATDIKKMSEDEVAEYRKSLDQVRIRGKDCPRPIKKWTQCGLPSALLTTLKKHGFEAPFAIQCQALPAIMSGRDVIGVAKTGSGKTLAFVIPMLRHIKAQPPLNDGDGPIGVIMAPTRELATQIFKETKLLAKPLQLTPVCAYGGAPMSQQVGDIKAGAEIVVCTPGRAIDLLTLNSGRVMNLMRTTYVVLDEADRMFDMGFEPQVMKIIRNVRPDRQTVMFSATFPKIVEKHAKSILTNPVQIICGGVSVVSDTITQHIEVLAPEEKNKRLLELLNKWYNLGDNILLFVESQEDADELFRDLIKAGYVALTLHGGKDQNDREHTLADFKNKDNTLMIATSVAARGLDVKDLSLVINYDCPNHYEDYVHRVGRTGRAGRKGTAYTFIETGEDQYAADLVRALELAQVKEIPEKLAKMADAYKAKEKKAFAMGTALKKASGFTSGKGFKFDEAEGKAAKDKHLQAVAGAGVDVDRNLYYDSDDEMKKDPEQEKKDPGAVIAQHLAAAAGENNTAAATATATPAVQVPVVDQAAQMAAAMEAAKAKAAQISAQAKAKDPADEENPMAPAIQAKQAQADLIRQAQLKAAQIAAQTSSQAQATNDVASMVAQAQAKAAQISAQAQAQAQLQAAQLQQAGLGSLATGQPGSALSAAQRVAALISARAGFQGEVGVQYDENGNAIQTSTAVELEINDYPQQARWKVTHKDAMNSIVDNYQVSVTTKGAYFAPGRNPPAGERKLYLTIEGTDENNVARAKRELRRMLEEAAAGVRDVGTAGRYNV